MIALADVYRASHVLFTAYDAGLFSILETPLPLDEIALQLDWNPRAARLILNALIALELLDQQNGLYGTTAAARPFLTTGSPYFLGNYIAHTAGTADTWNALPGALRAGHGPFQGRHPAHSEELRRYLLAMRDLAVHNAPILAKALDLHGRKRLIDLGAGCGGYAIACLKTYPELHATLLDCPEAIELARQETGAAGVLDRCSFLECDALEEDIGSGYDAILLGNVIHAYGAETNKRLIGRCYNALVPGGLLALRDFFLENGRTAPPAVHLFALHLFLHTEKGQCYSEAEVTEWLHEAGFALQSIHALGEKAQLLTAIKPGTT